MRKLRLEVAQLTPDGKAQVLAFPHKAVGGSQRSNHRALHQTTVPEGSSRSKGCGKLKCRFNRCRLWGHFNPGAEAKQPAGNDKNQCGVHALQAST